MAEATKKIRLDPENKTLYEKFQKFHKKELIRRLYKAFFDNPLAGLIPRQIRQCNADTNKPFSKATCTLKTFFNLEESQDCYPFGSIFVRGVKILNNLLGSEGYILEDYETKILLDPLLSFLFDEDAHIALRNLGNEANTETQVMMTLAVEFFCKLSVSSSCTMDEYAPRKTSYKLQNVATFGDTSIGHKDVWHGNLDIVLESSQIGVHIASLEEKSQRGRTGVEEKFKMLDSNSVTDQALAQTITFSFLQHQLHPAMKHFLIPSILVSNKEVQFLFYDSKNDILLQSKTFPFFMNGILNYQTVLAAWLVLNYKYLCSGPTPNILRAQKADFPKFAGASLEIYKTKLRFQQVAEMSSEEGDDKPWDSMASGHCTLNFEWPENLAELYEMSPAKKTL